MDPSIRLGPPRILCEGAAKRVPCTVTDYRVLFVVMMIGLASVGCALQKLERTSRLAVALLTEPTRPHIRLRQPQ